MCFLHLVPVKKPLVCAHVKALGHSCTNIDVEANGLQKMHESVLLKAIVHTTAKFLFGAVYFSAWKFFKNLVRCVDL